MVGSHCVRDEGTNADQWLNDWANLIGLKLALVICYIRIPGITLETLNHGVE